MLTRRRCPPISAHRSHSSTAACDSCAALTAARSSAQAGLHQLEQIRRGVAGGEPQVPTGATGEVDDLVALVDHERGRGNLFDQAVMQLGQRHPRGERGLGGPSRGRRRRLDGGTGRAGRTGSNRGDDRPGVRQQHGGRRIPAAAERGLPLVEPVMLVDGAEEPLRLLGRLGGAEKEPALRPQCKMEKIERAPLGAAIEVDEEVAAGDQIEP